MQQNSWTDRLLALATTIATWSKDPNTQVGAVATDSHNRVIATGYNGIPRNVLDLPERLVRPTKYLWIAHAEENLVANAARKELEGSTVYVTHICCNACARMLINAGVARIVMTDRKTSMDPDLSIVALTMLLEAGVDVTYIEDKKDGAVD
jgi:dCMP deaminase